ncbi:MAG: hypothetical protein ACUZ8E_04415 [Candidatus Anammoxibacter sp.]
MTSDLTHQQRLEAAFWMVGNMDTPENKKAWWDDFGPYWNDFFDNPHSREQAQRVSDKISKLQHTDIRGDIDG